MLICLLQNKLGTACYHCNSEVKPIKAAQPLCRDKQQLDTKHVPVLCLTYLALHQLSQAPEVWPDASAALVTTLACVLFFLSEHPAVAGPACLSQTYSSSDAGVLDCHCQAAAVSDCPICDELAVAPQLGNQLAGLTLDS